MKAPEGVFSLVPLRFGADGFVVWGFVFVVFGRKSWLGKGRGLSRAGRFGWVQRKACVETRNQLKYPKGGKFRCPKAARGLLGGCGRRAALPPSSSSSVPAAGRLPAELLVFFFCEHWGFCEEGSGVSLAPAACGFLAAPGRDEEEVETGFLRPGLSWELGRAVK